MFNITKNIFQWNIIIFLNNKIFTDDISNQAEESHNIEHHMITVSATATFIELMEFLDTVNTNIIW